MPELQTAADASAQRLFNTLLRMRDNSGMTGSLVLAKLLQAIADGGHLEPVNPDTMNADQAVAAQRFVDWLNSQG